MKRLTALWAVCLIVLCGCTAKPNTLAGNYVYEQDGFGGKFSVTLKNDGSFTYYEGALSSYIGGGTWTAEKETVVLKDGDRTFCFAIERGALVFVADRSDTFLYVDVQDGDRFVKP